MKIRTKALAATETQRVFHVDYSVVLLKINVDSFSILGVK